MLKPQDILVALKFLSPTISACESYATLADSIGLSASEAHAAVRRAIRSGLLLSSVMRRDYLPGIRPCPPALNDLLCYGVRYFIPAEIGRFSTGILTAESAPPISHQFSPSDGLPYIWQHARGDVKGISITPLYSSVPDAALLDPALGEWLALTEALRLSTGRVAELAKNEVRRRFREYTHDAAA